MSTDSKETHDEFIKYAKSVGLVDFVRGHNINGRDTYSDPETEIVWVVWSDLRAENARLVERVEKLKKHNRTIAGFIRQRNFDIAEANRKRCAAYAESARLREALENIGGEPAPGEPTPSGSWCQRIARAALEVKP